MLNWVSVTKQVSVLNWVSRIKQVSDSEQVFVLNGVSKTKQVSVLNGISVLYLGLVIESGFLRQNRICIKQVSVLNQGF